MTNTSISDDPGQDANFRENIRSQLQEKEAQMKHDYERAEFEKVMEEYKRGMQWFDAPFVSGPLRWLGGVLGVGLLVIGILWFLSIFGYTIPWYSALPLLLIIIGGSFVVAAVTTGRRRK